MACPFFVPVAPWPEADVPWPGPRRVPLGEPYQGKCSRYAGPVEFEQQAALCNFGYARGRCPHFPEEAVDALRFSITGAIQNLIRLVWIEEKNHAPLAHGASNYKAGSFDPPIPARDAAQARVFIETFLKGRSPQGRHRQ